MDLDEYFLSLGNQFYPLYQLLKKSSPIKVKLSQVQKARFNELFSESQRNYLNEKNDKFAGTVRRIGIINLKTGDLVKGNYL